jgi:hypothetical protein
MPMKMILMMTTICLMMNFGIPLLLLLLPIRRLMNRRCLHHHRVILRQIKNEKLKEAKMKMRHTPFAPTLINENITIQNIWNDFQNSFVY